MSEPPDSARTCADFDIRSPLRSYLRVGRDLIVEPEPFFRAVRGSSLWRPTLFAFVKYLVLSPLSVVFVLPPVLTYVGPTVVREYYAAGGGEWLMLALVAALAEANNRSF